jgi:PHD/YefM family antitoxin component YafN of YafNO toxin-antitoxin module
MKVVTLQQMEENFDSILEDVETNKEHYRIQCKNGDVMLVPIESYEILKATYKEWVEEPQNIPVEGFDPCQLPVVEYVAEASSKDSSV